MPYRPEQLPFIGYEEKVKAFKKTHDNAAHAYPLTIEVWDEQQKLLQQTFSNARDRNSKPQIVASGDWAPPLTFKAIHGEDVITWPLEEEVHVRKPGEIQLDLPDYFGDEG
jgi:hypothetical protein